MIITKAMFLKTFKRMQQQGITKDKVFDYLEIDCDQDYDPSDLDDAFNEVYNNLLKDPSFL